MSSSLRSSPRHFAHVPALPLRERTGLLDHHAVADVDVGVLGVREELARAPDVLLIHPVLDEVLDRHHDGLLHLVRDHHAGLGPLRCCLLPSFVRCLSSPFSSPVTRADRSSSSVLMRAISRRTSRIFIGFSIRPVARWKRSLNSCSRSSRSRAFSSSTLLSRSLRLGLHSPTSVCSRVTKRVLIGSLCAARRNASSAISRVTPSIS